MQDSKIIQVTQMMQNKQLLENDLQQAVGVVRNMFNEKYLNPITGAIKENHEQAKQNPSKEIKLMEAMKAFFPPEKHDAINKTINMMNQMEVIKNINSQLSQIRQMQPLSAQSGEMRQDSSIHSDGIYDIDNQCSYQRFGQPQTGNSLFTMFLICNMLCGFGNKSY